MLSELYFNHGVGSFFNRSSGRSNGKEKRYQPYACEETVNSTVYFYNSLYTVSIFRSLGGSVQRNCGSMYNAKVDKVRKPHET